jgi:predicted amidohydrolase YtcJ
MVLDGSPQAKTAYMSAPYVGECKYRGYPNLKDDIVYEVLARGSAAGLQVLAHCNGDAAAEQYVSAWERVVAQQPERVGCRPIMIHAQTVRYDQLDRLAKTGMMPSFFVGHCYYWGNTHLKNFGTERGSRISPLGAALSRGIPFSLHQDSPVTKPNMLHSVWCAVNRITRSGITVGPKERISVYDALIAATNGGAYGYFEEQNKGILKPGAVADLVILDKDPTAADPMDIKNIRVCETVKAGKTVYMA